MGKSAQKNPPGKSPGKSSKIYTSKILQHISADWPGQLFSNLCGKGGPSEGKWKADLGESSRSEGRFALLGKISPVLPQRGNLVSKTFTIPVLPFLGCSVLTKENLQIYQGYSFPAKHRKTLEKPEKRPILARKFLDKNQPRKSKQSRNHERKKHPKKICIKNFGGTLAGGSRRGLGAQILYVGVGFPSKIQCIKNFEGGGLGGGV